MKREPGRTQSRLVVGIDVRCLSDGDLRGISRYTIELIRGLARRTDVALVGISDRAIPLNLPIRVERYASGREVIAEQVKLPALARRLKLDVLLCPANRGLPLLATCPTVLTLHDAVEWDSSLVATPRGKSRARFNYSSIISLASASLVITVSEASSKAISQTLEVAPAKMRVTHEAAPLEFRVSHEVGGDSVLDHFDLESGYILYVGGFDAKKDLATLVRAYARVSSEGATPPLVLAGKGGEESDVIASQVDSLGLGSRVRFLGFVEDEFLPELYREALFFVFPAIAEGFGLPVIEAMAMGTPVLCAAAGSLPEVTGDGGQLFAPGDDKHLARLMRVLIDDRSLREVWSTAALERASHFSWDATAEATMRVLREAAMMPGGTIARMRLRELTKWRHRWR